MILKNPQYLKIILKKEMFAKDSKINRYEGCGHKKIPIKPGFFNEGSPCWTRTSDTLINSQVL